MIAYISSFTNQGSVDVTEVVAALTKELNSNINLRPNPQLQGIHYCNNQNDIDRLVERAKTVIK